MSEKNLDTLHGRVSISQRSSPDLFEFLAGYGRYYWTKQLVRLAIQGLAVEQGRFVANAQVAAGSDQGADQATSDSTRYSIPNDAAESLVDIFADF